jgi:hypothetical protein
MYGYKNVLNTNVADRIRIFFGLPDPYPLVSDTDPAPDPDQAKIVRKSLKLSYVKLSTCSIQQC